MNLSGALQTVKQVNALTAKQSRLPLVVDSAGTAPPALRYLGNRQADCTRAPGLAKMAARLFPLWAMLQRVGRLRFRQSLQLAYHNKLKVSLKIKANVNTS